MAPKMVHSMIRILNEERSVNFYKQAFELEVADRLDFESFTLIYMSNKETGFELELTINKDNTEAYDLGAGYGHLAFVVEDLEAYHQNLKTQGYTPKDIVIFNKDDAPLAKFFFIEDPDGYKIEVLQKMGRFK